jgi:phosphoglycolate phosphatase
VPADGLRAVLFDLDGTIMDSRRGIIAGLVVALAAVGVEVDDDHDWVPYLGPPLREVLAAQHGLSSEQIDIAVDGYLGYYEARGKYENEVYPGMAELLAALATTDVSIAVATSKRAFLADDILTHFQLRDRFAHVGGARGDGSGGTKKEVIEATLAAMDLLPGADIVMVGDRRHDIDGAKAWGLATIGVGWGYAPPGELPAAGADVVVATVADLTEELGLKTGP